MKIRCVNRQFVGLSSFSGLLLIAAGLCSVGCGSGESNEIAYSQNFEMPPGAKVNQLPDSASIPAFNRQKKLREDDRKEAANKSSKKRRP